MTVDRITLIISATALVVTIVGWFVTFRKQRQILDIQRGHQKIDRDLQIYRSRFPIASQVVAALYEMAFGIHALPAMYARFASITDPVRFQDSTQEYALSSKSLDRLPDVMRELPTLFNDPDYLSLINSLPDDASELIFNTQKEVFSSYLETTEIRAELSKLIHQKIPSAKIDSGLESLVEEFKSKLDIYRGRISVAMSVCEKAAKYISIGLALHEKDIVQENQDVN